MIKAPADNPPHLPDSSVANNHTPSDLGGLLQGFRQYLLLVAEEELAPELKRKLGASDLVQQTFLAATDAYPQFHGNTQEEFRGWLRAILLNEVRQAARRYRGTSKRNLSREIALPDIAQKEGPPARGHSPSSAASLDEESQALYWSLDQLSEDHRQVVEWRNFERLSFTEIGEKLGRSPDAARKLWSRAVDRLGELRESYHAPH